MSGMPIVLSASPRYSVTPVEGTTPRPFVIVDGAAAAGSKHLLGTADAQVELTRLFFESADDARRITIDVEVGQGSHAWSAMVVFDAEDDTSAAARFEAGYPEVKRVLPGQRGTFELDAGVTTCYVLGLPAQGSTPATCAGRIYVEGASYA